MLKALKEVVGIIGGIVILSAMVTAVISGVMNYAGWWQFLGLG